MVYTKRRFGAELLLMLEKGCTLNQISEWANKIYYTEINSISDEALETLILDIGSMCCDPQFEYNKKELEELAIKLIE